MTKQQLKNYCDAEFENIEAVLTELKKILHTETSNYSTAELAAIATFLHNFYNGIENIIKRVFVFKKMDQKDTPTWHKDMLKKALDIEIISNDLYGILSNYLSFRHFFVHSYSLSLRWEELNPLTDNVERTFDKIKASVYEYIDQLN